MLKPPAAGSRRWPSLPRQGKSSKVGAEITNGPEQGTSQVVGNLGIGASACLSWVGSLVG